MTDNERKADLIKKALQIVDELAELDINEVDDIDDLIERADRLKKDRFWKLN